MQTFDPDASSDAALWATHRASALAASGEAAQAQARTREALVARYTPLVRILAAKAYAQRISAELEFRDYAQFGMVGLLESIDRFQPEQGVKFESFASLRITGAILNGVESLSEKQRQVAVRQRVLRERTASINEGVEVRLDPIERLGQMALGLAIGLLLEDTGMYVCDEARYSDNTYDGVELRQLQRRVREAVARLPETERRIVHAHYLQHQPFDQLAIELGLSKGRVSQLHRAALKRLQDATS